MVNSFVSHAQENGLFLLAVQVHRNGELLSEWNRFSARPRFESYSTSKTFVGAGVGIAMQEGLLQPDDKLVDFFPEAQEYNSDDNLPRITVRHLLTMTSGMGKTMLWRDGYERRNESDWIKYVFKNGKFRNTPGSVFLYNNVNSYLLGCMIERRSGQNLREYLRYRLFEPIGIGNVEWTSCPGGHTIAANALQISVDELSRLGQLLAAGGEFNGKRILPQTFVSEMLTQKTSTGEIIPGTDGGNAGYGYQIWVDSFHNAAFMWGIFGQYCVVIPEKNAVVTVQGLEQSDGGSNGNYSESLLRRFLWEDIVTQL